MSRLFAFRAVLALLVTAGPAAAQSVDQLLAQLDKAAITFKGAKADMRRTSYVGSIHQNIVEDGSILVRRAGPGKLEFRVDIAGDNASSLVFRGQTGEQYKPGLNQIEVWDIRKFGNLPQKLMALGFGMSGKELAASYTISNLRRDPVAGHPAIAVDLASKSEDLVNSLHLRKVELWVSESDSTPVKQKFYFGGTDTWLVEYSNLQLNPKLPGNALDLPKGAKTVKMN